LIDFFQYFRCAIGESNLNKALEKFSNQASFEIEFHPYVIHPNIPKEVFVS